MSSTNLNNWLNIVAAIGVIAGLVLVAYELNQNTKLAHAEYYRDNYRMWMEVSAVEIESDINDVFIKSIVDPENLTPRELLDLNSWYILVLSIYDNAAREQETGIVTATNIIEEWEARYYFSSEYSRQWFQANKNWMRPENVEVISRVVESTPIFSEWSQLEEMLYRRD